MQKSVLAEEDERREALERWVAEQWGEPGAVAVPASTDASFRRYFRFARGDETQVAMDAPPPGEDCKPFVEVAALFGEAGVHVPRVLAQDLPRGFLLLEDLGQQTYLHVLDEHNADELFAAAIDALLKIQLASRPGVLPPYDEAVLRRELELFPRWYLETHRQWEIDSELRTTLDAVFEVLVQSALAQNRVFVHRDYMPRNLMISEPLPGVIDFQDALYGPISYDPICLFKDAFLSWPEARVTGWLRQYWERAREAGLPVPSSFERFHKDCDLMGAQRHLKVMGIFARIFYRDGKPAYLEDVARFEAYLRQVASRHVELAPLEALFDRLAQAAR